SGGETTAMDLASAAHLLTPFAYSSPGKSASGQMTTSRPCSGDQSALSALLLPFGLVTTTKPGSRRLAASVAFSPSQTTTGATGRSASSCTPSSGLLGGQRYQSHSSLPLTEARHSVNGRNSLPSAPSNRST